MTDASNAAPLYCNPLLLEDSPSFTSSTILAARFYFVRRGTNETWIWGGTTPLFLAAAEDKIRYSGLRTSSPFSAEVAYNVPGQPGSQPYSGAGGPSWDVLFNRALWNMTFRIWDDYARRTSQSSAFSQFLGQTNEPTTSVWMNILNEIKRCELERRVNATAFAMACRLAAANFNLIDNLTTSVTSPIPGTRMPIFGASLPAVRDSSDISFRPLVWPARGSFYDGFFPAVGSSPQKPVHCPLAESYLYGTGGAQPASQGSPSTASSPSTSTPSTPSLPASTSTPRSTSTATTSRPASTSRPVTGSTESSLESSMDPGKTSSAPGAESSKILIPLGYSLGAAAMVVGAGVALIAAHRARSA